MSAIASVLERGADVARRPGVFERLRALGELPGLPGPSRAELEELVGPAPTPAASAPAVRQPALH